MKILFSLAILSLTSLTFPLNGNAQNSEPENVTSTSNGHSQAVETLVLFRHGEKEGAGPGQLNDRGLNRALLLPDVLSSKFNTPAAAFAYKPYTSAKGSGVYYHMRPLLTIEPTLIKMKLPLNLSFSRDDLGGLQKELLDNAYANSTVFVCWEHKHLEKLAKNLMKTLGNNPDKIPKWKGSNFDSIYIFKVTASSVGQRSITFSEDHEGLNNLPNTFPAIRR